MNCSKAVGTHPFAEASLTARAEKPQEGFSVYCGDIKTPRPAASHIMLQLRVRILVHALKSPLGFMLTGEAKKHVSQYPTILLREVTAASAQGMIWGWKLALWDRIGFLQDLEKLCCVKWEEVRVLVYSADI